MLVNGGRRGLNLKVGVQDLIRLTGAQVVDAVRRDSPAAPERVSLAGRSDAALARQPGVTRDATLEITPRGAMFTLAALSHVGHPAHLALIDAYLKGQVRLTPRPGIGEDSRRSRRAWRLRCWPPTSLASSDLRSPT